MDPIKLSKLIEDRYRRYLKTTFYFRDPVLRSSFEKQLESGLLRKGPYLEATPVFKRKTTPALLLREILDPKIDEGFVRSLTKETPSLYVHQELAIRKVLDGRNVIVATGTGSGKTEAFLYPILMDLYREFQSGTSAQPGVRALILYPMNALANDQRERLGELCKLLRENNSNFRFTFGQYIGETPDDERDSSSHANDHLADRKEKGFSIIQNGTVIHGEMVLRSEMRANPPHILLTNYSMLEYLLLRPDDNPLFEKSRACWKFIVLDEAHQYRGTQGMEMGMLLRRLKQRLMEGERTETFRCIATSATLIGGKSGQKMVADFATNLFGEQFFEEDVVLGEIEPIHQKDKYELSLYDYDILKSGQNNITPTSRKELEQLASQNGVAIQPGEKVASVIGRILYYDRRTILLRNLITPQETTESSQWTMPQVEEVAQKVFPDLSDDQSLTALSDLIHLLLHAQDPTTQYDAPLMSARYHLFLRTLEGAFVSYGQRSDGTVPWPEKKVLLDRKEDSGQHATFEVALCRECGQRYFVGKIINDKFVEAIRDPSNADFGATYLRPIESELEQEDEEVENGRTREEMFLCLTCGQVKAKGLTCGHNNVIKVIKEPQPSDDDRKDQMVRCSYCGYNASGKDPVKEVVYGTDGPHAVIATTLVQYASQHLTEERRKVLAFADGRQEAAFFAWYLEDTYKDILNRNLIFNILKSLDEFPKEGLSLSEIVDYAFRTYAHAFKEKKSDREITVRKNIWRALYREFLTEERRISLEGVGLVQWKIELPKSINFPNSLTQWGLNQEETKNLLCILLDLMRKSRAVEFETPQNKLLTWSDLDLQAYQLCYRNGQVNRPKSVKIWPVRSWKSIGAYGNVMKTQQIVFLSKLLESCNIKLTNEEISSTLGEIWESLTQDERLLCRVKSYDARRLKPEWYALHLISDEDIIYQCSTCERIQSISVRNLCSNHQCSGNLVPKRLNGLKPNHYRDLYREELPFNLRVEEHTAQLDHEKARGFQKDFREGKIHVLSCSTTFELGVDLGSLDTVFLRNIPPEAFNYVQRVGRAGRRSGFPGFAITYCRKNSHDLVHFAEPQRMLSGHVKPPVLAIRNVKIIFRHITALALSKFLRDNPDRYKQPGDSKSRVERLFYSMEEPSAVRDFREYVIKNKRQLENAISTILQQVEPSTIAELGIEDGRWIEEISGSDSRFASAEWIISDDYTKARIQADEMYAEREGEKGDWAKARANTIASEDVVSFLSRTAVIPKYGFPVDVVELDTQRIKLSEGENISLQRDLSIAIAEFAPSSKLIANKKLWTSYGLKVVAGKAWNRWWYSRCKYHNKFVRKKSKAEVEEDRCCRDMTAPREYIDPQFGFVTNPDGPKKPTGRTSRVFTTRPYFAGFKKEGEKRQLPGIVTLSTVSPGFMVVLCEGRREEGFYVCGKCGAGFKNWNDCKKEHKTPLGKKCAAQVESLRPAVALGHEFITDAIQLQFHPTPTYSDDLLWFAYSLSYALLEGAAEVLDIPSNNLNATVSSGSQNNTLPPIILYDNVPGGAGLVAQLEDFEKLKDCVEKAFHLVTRCKGCPDNSSCYSCLRSYRNQFAHPYLQRGPVGRYLKVILDQW